jgi:hypothetical protein
MSTLRHPLQVLDILHRVLVIHLQTMDILQTLGIPNLAVPIHHHLEVTLLQMLVLIHPKLVGTHRQALVILLLAVDTPLRMVDMVGTPLLIGDTAHLLMLHIHLLMVHIHLPTLDILQVVRTLQQIVVTLHLLAVILPLMVAMHSLLLPVVTPSRLLELNIHLLVVAIHPQQVDILRLQVDIRPPLLMADILRHHLVTIPLAVVATHQLMVDTQLQQVKDLAKVLVLVAMYLLQAATMGILNQLPDMTALRYYLNLVEHIFYLFPSFFFFVKTTFCWVLIKTYESYHWTCYIYHFLYCY